MGNPFAVLQKKLRKRNTQKRAKKQNERKSDLNQPKTDSSELPDECVICYEPETNDNRFRYTTKCAKAHGPYHEKCILNDMKQNFRQYMNCPYCRKKNVFLLKEYVSRKERFLIKMNGFFDSETFACLFLSGFMISMYLCAYMMWKNGYFIMK